MVHKTCRKRVMSYLVNFSCLNFMWDQYLSKIAFYDILKHMENNDLSSDLHSGCMTSFEKHGYEAGSMTEHILLPSTTCNNMIPYMNQC